MSVPFLLLPLLRVVNGNLELIWLDVIVFFGCCIAGAATTQLLPESKGYDPDVIYAREVAEARRQ